MLTETYQLGVDGKVIPGVTVLRDPQTGQRYDGVSRVVDVVSGRMPTAIDLRGPSSGERCALYGQGAHWRAA